MTDQQVTPPPSGLSSQLAAALVRHLMTLAAGMLVTAGAVNHDQETQVITIGTSIVLWAVASAWSAWQKRHPVAR